MAAAEEQVEQAAQTHPQEHPIAASLKAEPDISSAVFGVQVQKLPQTQHDRIRVGGVGCRFLLGFAGTARRYQRAWRRERELGLHLSLGVKRMPLRLRNEVEDMGRMWSGLYHFLPEFPSTVRRFLKDWRRVKGLGLYRDFGVKKMLVGLRVEVEHNIW